MALPGDGDEGRSVGGGAFVINQKKARWGGVGGPGGKGNTSRASRGVPLPPEFPQTSRKPRNFLTHCGGGGKGQV